MPDKHEPDRDRYDALCRAIAPSMKGLATRLTGSSSAAEDVFQEAALRVWRRRPDLGAVRDVRAYFARAVTNLSFDMHRSRRRERQAGSARLQSAGATGPDAHAGLPDGQRNHGEVGVAVRDEPRGHRRGAVQQAHLNARVPTPKGP